MSPPSRSGRFVLNPSENVSLAAMAPWDLGEVVSPEPDTDPSERFVMSGDASDPLLIISFAFSSLIPKLEACGERTSRKPRAAPQLLCKGFLLKTCH